MPKKCNFEAHKGKDRDRLLSLTVAERQESTILTTHNRWKSTINFSISDGKDHNCNQGDHEVETKESLKKSLLWSLIFKLI